MTAYLYRPDHPQANENGMVDKVLVGYEPASALYVISDVMQPMRHMGTGRIIDSKAKFRHDTKVSGCIELGNEVPKQRAPVKLDRRERRDAIRKAVYELRNR